MFNSLTTLFYLELHYPKIQAPTKILKPESETSLQDIETIQERIVAYLRNHPEKRMSFDEIFERLNPNPNPKNIPPTARALNNLVKTGRARQYRAVQSRLQNHYELIE